VVIRCTESGCRTHLTLRDTNNIGRSNKAGRGSVVLTERELRSEGKSRKENLRPGGAVLSNFSPGTSAPRILRRRRFTHFAVRERTERNIADTITTFRLYAASSISLLILTAPGRPRKVRTLTRYVSITPPQKRAPAPSQTRTPLFTRESWMRDAHTHRAHSPARYAARISSVSGNRESNTDV
jgi:hypothetical protein